MRFFAAALALALGLLGCSSSSSPAAPSARPTPSLPPALAGATGWLAYQSGSRTDHVHLVHVDGVDDHLIGEELPGEQRHPDFSRTDGRLAFDLLDSSDKDQLYIAAADGTAPRRLAECTGDCDSRWEPAWSPDGTRIVLSTAAGPVVGDAPRDFGLAVLDVATEKIMPVISHPSAVGQDHLARWSPDGTRLVFWRTHLKAGGRPETAVMTVRDDGTGLRQLTPWSMNGGDPDWSPTTDSIVFSTRPLLEFSDGPSELWTVQPDGSGLRRLTTTAPAERRTQPRWTPRGDAVLYTRVGAEGRPRHIWLLSVQDQSDVPVLDTGPIYTHAALQP